MVAHSAIADPYRHEPKDIALAGAGRVYVANGAGSGEWTLLPSLDVSLYSTPVGAMVPFGGTTAPSLWLLCYGQAVSRTTYSALFTKLGVLFGAGDGSTTFNLPDTRGRLIAGYDLAGGVSGDRLTGLAGGVDGDTIGAAGGSETATLVAANVPPFSGTTASDGLHTHNITNGTQILRAGISNDAFTATSILDTFTITISTDGLHNHPVSINPGGGSAHNNVQPTIIANYIIYAGV